MAFETPIWASGVNTTPTSGASATITKTGGSDLVADAGAISSQQLAASGAAVSFVMPATDKQAVIGLLPSASLTYSDYTHSFNFSGTTTVEIHESGGYVTDFTFSAVDVFSMTVTGTTVEYFLNGVSQHVSSVPVTLPTKFGVLFLSTGAEITTAQIDTGTVVVVPPDTSAFDALLEKDAARFIVLVEPQPAEILGPFTFVSGVLWSAEWSDFVQEDVVKGGLYRRLDFVREDATNYTERTSTADVQANPGSYYFDPSAGLIYISTTTGSSPEAFANIGAWFTLPLATDTVNLPGQPLYYPLVTGSLPTITQEKPDILFGAMVTGSGAVSFLNGDGLFDKLLQRFVWRNKVVTIKLGGPDLAYDEFQTIVVMRINNAQLDDATFTLQLETMGSILNRALCQNTWGITNLFLSGAGVSIALGEGVSGQYQPIVFGKAQDCVLPLIGTTAGKETYGTVDAVAQPIGVDVLNVYAIHRTNRTRTVLTDGFVDYTTTDYTVVILNDATYPSSTYEIWADLWDQESNALDGVSFGTFTQLLLQRAGESIDNIDLDAIDEADEDSPAPMGLFLTDGTRSAADVLRQAERSAGYAGGQVTVSPEGLWTPRVWSPSLPADHELLETDFKEWTVEQELVSVLNEVRVSYAKERTNRVDRAEVSASDDRVRYSSETTDRTTVDSLLIDEDHARALANHLLFRRSRPPALIAFEERGLSLMRASVGDKVAVTRSRAPLARTGRYDGHILEIQKIEKSLSGLGGVPVVRGVLNDLDGQTDRIFRLAPAGSSLNWSTATDQEKAVYGFLTDENGYL